MSDLDDFRAFYTTYAQAMAAGDETLLRQTLPPDIPEEHLAFLLQMNQGFYTHVLETGLEPSIAATEGRIEVHYESTDADGGEESMTRPFWREGDRWLSYDPADPDAG